MAEGLQLTLLGNLEVLHDGLLVTDLRSRKALALLCYLAVTGRPHLRPLLVGLLWGEMPEALARNNLSKALTQLRQVVGHHLIITRHEVAFDRERPYWLDVEAFEQGASALADIEGLQRAVELYGGDFLEGFYVHQRGCRSWLCRPCTHWLSTTAAEGRQAMQRPCNTPPACWPWTPGGRKPTDN
jgi:DNA-binding SARP family transcriptional activator